MLRIETENYKDLVDLKLNMQMENVSTWYYETVLGGHQRWISQRFHHDQTVASYFNIFFIHLVADKYLFEILNYLQRMSFL